MKLSVDEEKTFVYCRLHDWSDLPNLHVLLRLYA